MAVVKYTTITDTGWEVIDCHRTNIVLMEILLLEVIQTKMTLLFHMKHHFIKIETLLVLYYT